MTQAEYEEMEKAMATNMKLAGEIVKYLEKQYERYGKYKFYTKEITKAFSNRASGDIASTLSYMRKHGDITTLEETVPRQLQRGGNYFALTSVLDKMTSPESPVDNAELNKEEVSTVMTVPEQAKPSIPVANPFDSVNQKLATIMAQLDDIQNKPAVPEIYSEGKFVFLIQKAIGESVAFKNLETRMLTTEDLSKLFTNYGEQLNENLGLIHSHIANAPKFGGEEYQRGLRDGIRMAIEMGLKLSNGE